MKQLRDIDCSRLTMLFIVYDHVQAEYGCHVLVDRGVKQNFPEYHRTSGGGGSYYGLSEDTEALAEDTCTLAGAAAATQRQSCCCPHSASPWYPWTYKRWLHSWLHG